MKKPLLAITVLILLALACGSSAPQLKTTADFVKEFGGNPDVYDRILKMTECPALQEEFNIAEENTNIGYMKAADQRMREIGCYDDSSVPLTVDIAQIIQATANAALVQTQLASSPTLNVTSTFLPTLTQPATLAVIDTLVPPAIILPFDQPTSTAFILPTNPPVSGSVCSCTGDTLNCKDFSSQSSAQACFNFCVAQGAGDIHGLDANNDGLACESLP